MSDTFLSAGQSSSDITLSDGDSLYVGSGAFTSDIHLGSGSAEFVTDGGQAIGMVVSAGGFLWAAGGPDAAAVISDGTIEAGAEAVISFDGTATSVHVESGGLLSVVDGAATTGSIVSSGAFETVDSGATTDDTEVQNGGTLVILPGASQTDTTVDPGGRVVSTGLFFFSSTDPFVVSGMSAVEEPVADAVLGSGADVAILPSGLLIDATVQSSGSVTVYSGGTMSGGTIEAGGSAIIGDGASAVDITVENGGSLVLSSDFDEGGLPTNATLSGITIENGGAIDVENATVSASLSGDTLTITSGSKTATIELSGDYAGEYFALSGDGNGGTLATLTEQSDSGQSGISGYDYVDTYLTANQSLTVSAGQTSLRTSAVIPSDDYIAKMYSAGSVDVYAPEEDVYGVSISAYIYGGEEAVHAGGISYDAYISGNYYDEREGSQVEGEITIDDGGKAYSVIAEGYAAIVVGGDYPPDDSDPAVLSGAILLSGAELDIYEDGVVSGVTIGSGSVVSLYSGAELEDTVVDPGGSIDLPSLAYRDGGTAKIEGDPVLEITEGNVSMSVTLDGDYTGEYFVLSDDGNGGTLATLEEGTPCYCRGTRIATETGEVPVEDLRIGDLLRTASGALRPVRWIGRRSYSGRFASGNRDVLPVVFRAGSLGDGLPRRDLSVSPLHAMFLDGVLIPAVLLVNGVTIVQAEAMDEVSYFHIELDSHDVLLGEGAPSESFVDDDSRGMFHNAAEYRALYPDASREPACYCAPRIEEGPLLEEIRRRLDPLREERIALPLEGFLDTVTRTTIRGWARNPASDEPVRLRIANNGVTLGEIIADQPRPDIGTACGFSFTVPGGLSPSGRHVIEIQPAGGGTTLGNTPWVLDQQALPDRPAAGTTNPPMRGYVDIADRHHVTGWAFDPATPDVSVPLQIIVNGRLHAATVANGRRPDVLSTGACPSDRCGFELLFTPTLSPLSHHVIEVRRERDGALLAAPEEIPAAGTFGPDLERTITVAVAALGDKGDHAHVLSFLLAQAERVKQSNANHESGLTERALASARARRGLIEAPARNSRRALVIDSRIPDAHRDAGSVAILSHMHALRMLGYAVSFVAADAIAEHGKKIAPDITVLGQPFHTSVEDVLRRQEDSFDIVYLHRQDIATTYLPLVRRHQRRARVLYSVADLHHLRLARQAAVEERPELLARAQRVRAAEYAVARQADAVLTHSSAEAALLRRDVKGANVHVAPWAVPVRGRVPGFDKRHGVAFIGNFSHAPNIDAAMWLAQGIMPRVQARVPEITCLIVGADMPGRVARLTGEGIEVIGAVPDLRDVLDRVRLTVAPLRFGAGVKGKVLESFAAGVPCVMTPVAAEGLDLPDALAGLIAGDADALAERIVRLHTSRAVHANAARTGKNYIRVRNNDDAVAEALRGAPGLGAMTRRTG